MGADEYKQAKILLNMSTFLQFLLHISLCDGMLIMGICAYSLIWIFRNLKCVKKSSNIKVWLEERMFNSFIQ
jgi:hypothetical protein